MIGQDSIQLNRITVPASDFYPRHFEFIPSKVSQIDYSNANQWRSHIDGAEGVAQIPVSVSGGLSACEFDYSTKIATTNTVKSFRFDAAFP